MVIYMTMAEFRRNMLAYAVGAAKTLCEGMTLEDTKLEPEQVRKNAATILVILTETEDFLESLNSNECSNSDY